jgi:VanZ family protein
MPSGFRRLSRFLFNLFFTWGPVGMYCFIIFTLSSRPGLAAPLPFPAADKLAHALEYAILGGLWARAMSQSWRTSSPSPILLSAVLFTTLYGVSDEWHQAYVPGRIPEIADIFADMVGGVLGSLGFFWCKAQKKAGGLCF